MSKSEILKKMLSSRVDSPYPHFAIDDFLDDGILNEISNNWPDKSLFTGFFRNQISYSDNKTIDVTGKGYNYVFSFDRIDELPEQQRNFWHSFLTEYYYPIISDNFSAFSDEIRKKYGDDLKQVIYMALMLMEADEGYGTAGLEMDAHTHYFHDPLMLFTNLLYVDGNETCGTTIYYWNKDLTETDVDRAAYVCAQTRKWKDYPELIPIKHVDFIPNRFVSFVDGPLSFHGVDYEGSLKLKPTSSGIRRRMIRSHVGATPDFCEKIYGVSLEEFREMAKYPTDSPSVLGWYIKDINLQLKKEVNDSFNSVEYTNNIHFVDYPTVTSKKNIFTSREIVDAPPPQFTSAKIFLKMAVQRCFNALGLQVLKRKTLQDLLNQAGCQVEPSSDKEDYIKKKSRLNSQNSG